MIAEIDAQFAVEKTAMEIEEPADLAVLDAEFEVGETALDIEAAAEHPTSRTSTTSTSSRTTRAGMSTAPEQTVRGSSSRRFRRPRPLLSWIVS